MLHGKDISEVPLGDDEAHFLVLGVRLSATLPQWSCSRRRIFYGSLRFIHSNAHKFSANAVPEAGGHGRAGSCWSECEIELKCGAACRLVMTKHATTCEDKQIAGDSYCLRARIRFPHAAKRILRGLNWRYSQLAWSESNMISLSFDETK